jgi:hypothetical protein
VARWRPPAYKVTMTANGQTREHITLRGPMLKTSGRLAQSRAPVLTSTTYRALVAVGLPRVRIGLRAGHEHDARSVG